MAEMNETRCCSDREVSTLYNNTEKSNEEKNENGSYYLMSDRVSSTIKYSESSLDIALEKIIKGKRKDKKSSKVKNELISSIYEKPVYLTEKHIKSWVNTGYLPFQTVLNNAEVVDTGSLNEKQSYHKSCDATSDSLYIQGFVDIDKADSIRLCDNNSFNCTSVDTTAYILSNIKAKKKSETMATVVSKSSSKILSKNTLHENTSLEKDETQNMHINSNLSMSNVCDSDEKRTKNKTEENNINNENDSTLKEAINIENSSTLKEAINMETSFNSRRSRQKKLYTGRESPMDIVVAQFKNNNILDAKKNLHPAFRNSPPPEESSKKLLHKKRRSKFAKHSLIRKSLDIITNNNLEKETCIPKKETDFIDLEDNLTIFQNSMPSERLQVSCKALMEQIKRFPTSDYINNVNNEKRHLRGRKLKTKEASSKTTFTIDNISKDFQMFQNKLNPWVILERLSEEIIQYYTKKKMLQAPKEKLMENNKINDKDMYNISNPETCLNSSSTTIFNSEIATTSIDSEASTVLLYNYKDVSISYNFLGSDCSTVILHPFNSSNPDNINNKSDKDLEENQLDKDLEENQSNKVTEENQLDKDLEENQLDKDLEENQLNKVADKNSDNCSGTDLDTGLNKELDKELNKDIDEEKLKYLQPIVAIKQTKIQRRVNNSHDIDKSELPLIQRMKIQRRVNNSNDTETSKKFVRCTSKGNKQISKKLCDYISQFNKEECTKKSLNNILNNTAFIKALQPVVMLRKLKDLTNLKKNCAFSSKEKLSKLISSDNKLSMRPIVKLKRLSPKYNVKSLHKSNNKRYKDSSENDKVQVKKRKFTDNLGENNCLSLVSSKLKRRESSRQRVQENRPTRHIKRLPKFCTNNNHSTSLYDSDSNSESNSESNSDLKLDTNQPFMQCIFNFYGNRKQRDRKNTKLLDDNDCMVRSVSELISQYTNVNTCTKTRSHSMKNLSIIDNVSKLLNNTRMNEIKVNMTCSTSNQQCNTTLKTISEKTVSSNKKNKKNMKRLIVNKKNNTQKSTFATKVYETDSDSSRSE